nr:histidine phosphatase family protein [Rhodocyclus gracilis]
MAGAPLPAPDRRLYRRLPGRRATVVGSRVLRRIAVQVFLIRHARPLIAPGVCYGRLDVAADAAESVAAAERLAPGLMAEATQTNSAGGISLICSPAQRCQLLAGTLARQLGTTAHADERLLEKSFGAWEGKAWNAIELAQIDAWAADMEHFVPPARANIAPADANDAALLRLSAEGSNSTFTGESVAMLRQRAIACVSEWQARTAAQGRSALAVVTHAGVIRVLLGHWLGLPVADWSTLTLDFGRATRVDFAGKDAVLHTLNG